MGEQPLCFSNLFRELLPNPSSDEKELAWTEVFVAQVEPRQCGPLVKMLSTKHPLSARRKSREHLDLSHLRRVRKITVLEEDLLPSDDFTAAPTKSPAKKKPKLAAAQTLEVLLGPVEMFNSIFDSKASAGKNNNSDLESPILEDIIRKDFQLTNSISRLSVPARPAESKEEWETFNDAWPTHFYPNKTKEYYDEERKLTTSEYGQMKYGIEEAIKDAQEGPHQSVDKRYGTIVISPESGRVLARSSSEQNLQESLHGGCISNPLATSILFAIQGVSRLERAAAMAEGMESEAFQKGQYICTGLDVYTTVEPTVFEAMSLVHSRVRRVIFWIRADAAFVGGYTQASVHALPGTNHKYRVFEYRPDASPNASPTR